MTEMKRRPVHEDAQDYASSDTDDEADSDLSDYSDVVDYDDEDPPFDFRRYMCGSYICRLVKPYVMNEKNRRIIACVILSMCVLAALVFSGHALLNYTTTEWRWTPHYFGNTYWHSYPLRHLGANVGSGHIKRYTLKDREAPDGFGAPSLVLRRSALFSDTERCPPGFKSKKSNVVGMSKQPVSGEDSDVYSVCVRHPSRGMRPALMDADANVCSDPYGYACAKWDRFFSATSAKHAGVTAHPLDVDAYNSYVQRTIREVQTDEESLLYRFLSEKKPKTAAPDQQTAGLWNAVSAAIDARELFDVAFSNNHILLNPFLYNSAPLCAEYALVQRIGEELSTSIVQTLLGYVATDYDNLSAATLIESLCEFVHARLGDCSGGIVTHGALGDGAMLQVDMFDVQSSSTQDYSGVPLSILAQTWKLHALLMHVCAWYTGLDTVLHSHALRMRFALPASGESLRLFSGERHLQRLGRLTLAETLGDRYTLGITERIGRPTLRSVLGAVESCFDLTPHRTVFRLLESTHEERRAVALCMSGFSEIHPLNAALLAQRCNSARRDRAASGEYIYSDPHIPAGFLVRTTEPRQLMFTAAYLQAPWFPAATSSERGVNSEALLIPLYYSLTKMALEHNDDASVLRLMQKCWSMLMNAPFWIEFLQNWCVAGPDKVGGSAQVHILNGLNSTAKTSKYWKDTLQQNEQFRKAFQCKKE